MIAADAGCWFVLTRYPLLGETAAKRIYYLGQKPLPPLRTMTFGSYRDKYAQQAG
jgi:hypothetical protein